MKEGPNVGTMLSTLNELETLINNALGSLAEEVEIREANKVSNLSDEERRQKKREKRPSLKFLKFSVYVGKKIIGEESYFPWGLILYFLENWGSVFQKRLELFTIINHSNGKENL